GRLDADEGFGEGAAGHPAIGRQAQKSEDGRGDVEETGFGSSASGLYAFAPGSENAVESMPECSSGPVARREPARPVRPPFEAVVGVDEERRPVLLGAAHPLPEHPVDEGIVRVDDLRVAREIRLRRAGELRRRVRSEEMADLVRSLEVEGDEVRALP